MGKPYSDDPVMFNMGVATLEKINNVLIELRNHRLENNIPMVLRCLEDFSIESQIFLNYEDGKKSKEMWKEIESLEIEPNGNNSICFDQELLIKMKDYEIWLRKKLQQKNVFMPSFNSMKGLGKLEKGYGLQN